MVTYKDIAIVYTSKNNDDFLANGYDIIKDKYPREISFFDSDGYYSSHLNDNYYYNGDRIFNIIKKSINDVTDDIIHLYSVENPAVSLSQFEEFNISFPEKVIEYTNINKNFYIVLLTEHEPDNEIGFLSACNKFKKDGINLEKLIILNNNSKIYEYKEKSKEVVLVNKSFFLNFSSTKVLNFIGSDFVLNKEGKFFMSRNRTCNKLHRKNLMFDILKNNLENDINYSYININQNKSDNEYSNYTPFQGRLIVDYYREICDKVDFHYKECDYEMGLEYIDRETKQFIHQDKFNHNMVLVPELKKSFENSYFNIITESCFMEENVIHITEKSLRPFHYYQFPIFLATKGHVNQLRKYYDFDLFDDMIDHSYDNEEDFKKRYRMVIDEIIRIDKNKDKFIEFYKNNKDRFLLNKEKLHSFGKRCKELDIDFFWNL